MDKKTTAILASSIVLAATTAALIVINDRAIVKLRRDVDNLMTATSNLIESNAILIERTKRKEK